MRHLRPVVVAAALTLALVLPGTASAHIQSLSIDENATLSPGRQGITVSGTIACTAGETWAILQARVIQGQRSGFGSLFSQTCTGEPQQWSLVVVSSTGLWHPGRASAGITVITLGEDGADQVQRDRFIHVTR
jgi:hypothetical protein